MNTVDTCVVSVQVTPDESIYRSATMKGRLVEHMQDVLKRASVDCRIHLDAHRVTSPDHSCLTRCANVPRQAFVRS